MANTRLNIAGMAMLYPVFLYYTVTRPIPRKLYTDIICDSGPDGQYVREVLRTKKPGLWKKISAQLHTNNFSFPEMIEFKGIDFTSDFVQNRVI